MDQDNNPVIELPERVVRRMRALAQKAYPNETGGIVIGRYDNEYRIALVERITGAPQDSISGPSTFHRGVCGIDALLARVWRHGLYYLGEWHFHPEPQPRASYIDERQIAEFARIVTMQCPEPLLLIVGSSDGNAKISGYVYNSHFRALRAVAHDVH